MTDAIYTHLYTVNLQYNNDFYVQGDLFNLLHVCDIRPREKYPDCYEYIRIDVSVLHHALAFRVTATHHCVSDRGIIEPP